MADQRIPVTVLTGLLGSGKTTLLNRILAEQHGRRIAVIENEFGEVGIDDALVLNSEEEVFEMNNGCICCTVRGDLIRILGSLLRRKDRFDAILIETTGLADPAPVAQTFFMDALRAELRLDAIVTVVDAHHVLAHLDEVKPDGVENEAVEQIAFADRVVLNKIDLVNPFEADDVTRAIWAISGHVAVLPAVRGDVDLAEILDIRAFDLDAIMVTEPDFLDPDSEHQHDQSVTSVGIDTGGTVNPDALNTWLGALLVTRGPTCSAARACSTWPTPTAATCSRACTCSTTASWAPRGATGSRGATGWCSSGATSTAASWKPDRSCLVEEPAGIAP